MYLNIKTKDAHEVDQGLGSNKIKGCKSPITSEK